MDLLLEHYLRDLRNIPVDCSPRNHRIVLRLAVQGNHSLHDYYNF